MDIIKVCDAIMGSGKSSAAINYMNSHPEKKFIYITPYLEEAKRVKDACNSIEMIEPSKNIPDMAFSKGKHTEALLKSGSNIVSTHNMFLRYTDEMIKYIKRYNYMLIVDEAVDVLWKSDVKTSDVKLMENAGWITREDGYLNISPSFEYADGVMKDIVALARGNRLIDIDDISDTQGHLYYWVFSKEIFKAFSDVIVLTYMFEAQEMRYYLDLVGLPYEYIGIKRGANGEYLFSDKREYIPEYTQRLSSLIHVFDNPKLNDIGNHKHSLSYTWYSHTKPEYREKKERLRKNLRNFFINYHKDSDKDSRLWAVYKAGEKFVRGKGYFYNHIAFNAKATNDYRNKTILAYLVNVFMHPSAKIYLQGRGIEVFEDRWALSIMVQWIWRSAIRDGNEIWIYVPSKRMRTLLTDWIAEVERLSFLADKTSVKEVV